MSASDPRPWLEEGASGDLKSLLESAKLDEPSSDQLASLAKKMAPLLLLPAAAAVVAPAAAGGAGAGAAAAGKTAAVVATAAKTGLAVKVIVTVAAVAAVGGGAFQAGRVYEDKVAPPKMIERPVIVVAPPAPVPVVVPEPEPVVEPEPTPEPVAPPKPVVKAAPKPEAEAALLEQAMTALKAQDYAKALSLCDRHAREAGAKGLLIQEREVIAIEALVRLGRSAEAKARAEKFKQAFPTSTHLLKVESLAGGTP